MVLPTSLEGESISGLAFSQIEWLAPTVTRRNGHFVFAYVDSTLICWDKEREDWDRFLVNCLPKAHQSTPHTHNLPSSSSNHKRVNHPPRAHVDLRDKNIITSGLNHNLPAKKHNQLNPLYQKIQSHNILTSGLNHNFPAKKLNGLNLAYHWKFSQKGIKQQWAMAKQMLKHPWLEGVVVMGEPEPAAACEQSKKRGNEWPSKGSLERLLDSAPPAALDYSRPSSLSTQRTSTTGSSTKLKLTGSAGAGPAKGASLGTAPAAISLSTPDSATQKFDGAEPSQAPRSVSGSQIQLKAGSPTTVFVG
ncbi:hypothetical protein PtB15_11B225 [Puccinia triticina]|nr:hypothetical protein PtB15_11B225 [Puccinia triticina]